MPRDWDEASSGSTLYPSPSRVLAKLPNTTNPKEVLAESSHAPQGPIEKGSPLPVQRPPPTPSTIATRAGVSGDGEPASELLATEVANLNKYLQAVSSQAAGHVLQKFWRKFLFSDNGDDHLCWVLRAGLKNAPSPVIERVLKDPTIVNIIAPVASKKPVIAAAVLEDLPYDELIQYIPESALDQGIAQRLKTMPAKPLIRLLAEAERLGFREDDILNEDDESVMPNLSPSHLITQNSALPSPYTNAPANCATENKHTDGESESGSGDVVMLDTPPGHYNHSHHTGDHLLAVQGRDAVAARQRQLQHTVAARPSSSNSNRLACPDCHLVLPTASGYNYHVAKKFCQAPPPAKGYKFSCQNCARCFTTKQGMNYHISFAKVCFGDDIAPATSPPNQPQSHPQPQHLQQPQPTIYSIPRVDDQSGAVVPPLVPLLGQSPPAQPPVSQYHRHDHVRPLSTAKIPRPPLQTPASKGHRSRVPPSSASNVTWPDQGTPDSRMSPSELSPLKFAQLNKALADQEAKYQTQCAAVDPNLGPRDREARLQSLKNGHATKKSQIRKSFGVSLRARDKTKSNWNTPSMKSNLQEYRADPAVTRVTQGGESIPVRPSPLSVPSSSFSPVNAPRNNEPTQSIMPSENPNRGPIEYQPNAYKRQRTDYALPGQFSEQPPSARTIRSTALNRTERTEMSAVSSNAAQASVNPSASATPMNGTQYIDIASTSEDSGSDEILQRSSRLMDHATVSNGGHDAVNAVESSSFEKNGSAGSVRGGFTAKRGVHD